MNDKRARSSSLDWDRARRAYRSLIEEVDPAAAAIGRLGAIDLRPGGRDQGRDGDAGRAIVVAGPSDLCELREIVETSTGIGTWPTPTAAVGELLTVRLVVERPAPLLALLTAMEGLIEDRSAWRTWRTAVDTLAARVETLRQITIEARIIMPSG